MDSPAVEHMTLTSVIRSKHTKVLACPVPLLIRLIGRRQCQAVGSAAVHEDVSEYDLSEGVEATIPHIEDIRVVPPTAPIPIFPTDVAQRSFIVHKDVPGISAVLVVRISRAGYDAPWRILQDTRPRVFPEAPPDVEACPSVPPAVRGGDRTRGQQQIPRNLGIAGSSPAAPTSLCSALSYRKSHR